MSNKTYDILKLVSIILPIIASFAIGFGEIWGIDVMAPIGATITLLSSCLGAFLVKASKSYHELDNEVDDEY